MDYTKELNEEQLNIVINGDGTSLVIAGPGSGKTRTLVYRLCNLLERGERPESILLLTFTNKAAREMKNRAENLIGANARQIVSGTFHYFANQVVKKYANHVGLKKNFTILDEEDARSLLKQAILDDHESVKRGVVNSIQQLISLSKLKMESIEELVMQPEFFHMRIHTDTISDVAKKYEKLKKSKNLVDFDDLLFFAYTILSDKTISEQYKNHFTNILVDEFQDTDKLQTAILDLIYKKNLMVVGDDSQSIYSFRGADIKNILEFRDKYNAQTFFLTKNYRSTKPIVTLINETMANSKEKLEKQLVAITNGNDLPTFLTVTDKIEEAHIITNLIELELKEKRKVGVLFRAAYLAGELEVDLSRRGIKYEMRGGVKFFEQRHIKDMVSLLKVYHNPSDHQSLSRLFLLFPKVGEKSISKIINTITDPLTIPKALAKIGKNELYSSLISDIYSSGGNAAFMLDNFYENFYRQYLEEKFDDAEERKPDIEALVGAASHYQSIGEFLEAFSLDVDSSVDNTQCNLILSTIHQAKGLEWDSVFIIGLADGSLPHERSFNIEEERRLFYVATSRAKEKLIMSYPKSTGRFYESNEMRPSRFLVELPEHCYSQSLVDSTKL
ncbi:MAG: ATP-dependent helicase [Candidatus Micrarchaeota archaeon]